MIACCKQKFEKKEKYVETKIIFRQRQDDQDTGEGTCRCQCKEWKIYHNFVLLLLLFIIIVYHVVIIAYRSRSSATSSWPQVQSGVDSVDGSIHRRISLLCKGCYPLHQGLIRQFGHSVFVTESFQITPQRILSTLYYGVCPQCIALDRMVTMMMVLVMIIIICHWRIVLLCQRNVTFMKMATLQMIDMTMIPVTMTTIIHRG